MFKRISKLLRNISPRAAGEEENRIEDSLEFAVAVLLVEIMHADHQLDERERSMVIKLMQSQFGMDESDAIELFSGASDKMDHVVSLHQYTSRINSDFSYPQKEHLMLNLWRVVFADGRVDKYEEHLVRRVADLVYLSHKDFIKAKHAAEANPL